MRTARWAAVVALLVTSGVAACSNAGAGGDELGPSPTSEPERPNRPPRPGTPADSPACPGGKGGSDAASKVSAESPSSFTLHTQHAGVSGVQRESWKRPVVRLCFDVPADRKVVKGHESVEFTPDKRICEAVFRAWPNKPETAYPGNRLDVGVVKVGEKQVKPKVEQAGAPEGWPGTLIRVPLPSCAKAGTAIRIDLDFALTLGADTPERVGYSKEDKTVWLGTAFPLLAWESGHGWATGPAVELMGETVMSEVFQLRALDVVVPEKDEVAGTGRFVGKAEGPRDGTVIHRFSADAVRDVAVSVGRFDRDDRTVNGVRVHTVGPEGSPLKGTVREWAALQAKAIRDLEPYLGKFPYKDLWVTIVPDVPTGIEFPGAIQYGDIPPSSSPELVPHETAHMWFYGLVGNDQGRNPWLDESFADYAETLVNGTGRSRISYESTAKVRNKVGESMWWYDKLSGDQYYGEGVYTQGSAMLHSARQAVGPAKWDRLLRAYIKTNANRIVRPGDLVKAFRSEPKALAIFRRFGAIE